MKLSVEMKQKVIKGLQRENERLRRELALTEAACKELVAEAESLKERLATAEGESSC